MSWRKENAALKHAVKVCDDINDEGGVCCSDKHYQFLKQESPLYPVCIIHTSTQVLTLTQLPYQNIQTQLSEQRSEFEEVDVASELSLRELVRVSARAR